MAITKDLTARYLQAFEMLRAEGVSRREFCGKTGIVYTNLFSIEKGLRSPTLAQVVLLVQEYGISAEWLFRGIGFPRYTRLKQDEIIGNIRQKFEKFRSEMDDELNIFNR
ncbi:MAG: helix-turn-helix transcriptional regulator [Prevotellaceae bacterium]|nr:helix-turn-helix transcriptional regulator [Prevotellaceae bacterium]